MRTAKCTRRRKADEEARQAEVSGVLVRERRAAKMNRSIFALQQVARRTLCSSARRSVENKVPKNQKLFQEDNGIPVHLKGGVADAVLYRATMTLTVLGVGYVMYELLKAAKAWK
ncbi:cytochrome c oxidase subunit 7A2b [Syngnathus scovelli]|uniref:cytochrome c oxidase subunit 7A2b n=1 Tax=Syngnathus scovelli TaxID=161590 RepID=UPI0021108CB5|nr:cytochrome c oxidase subunit 7A2, mitochondrial [Syngnathus scovelli]